MCPQKLPVSCLFRDCFALPLASSCLGLIDVPLPKQSRNGELLGREVVRLSDTKTGTALANIYKGRHTLNLKSQTLNPKSQIPNSRSSRFAKVGIF
jgi:hypothetical protein